MVAPSGCSLYTLTGLSLLFGAVTVVTLALAVATDCWLFMSEPYQLTAQEMRELNITEPIQTDIVVHVRTGLWRVCTTNLMNGKVTTFGGRHTAVSDDARRSALYSRGTRIYHVLPREHTFSMR